MFVVRLPERGLVWCSGFHFSALSFRAPAKNLVQNDFAVHQILHSACGSVQDDRGRAPFRMTRERLRSGDRGDENRDGGR